MKAFTDHNKVSIFDIECWELGEDNVILTLFHFSLGTYLTVLGQILGWFLLLLLKTHLLSHNFL